jgi:hypothetical protein
MSGRDNEIGHCRCPVCASEKARLRVSTKQLAYITCDSCNVQLFARSDRSDRLVREFVIGQAAQAAAPAPVATPPVPAELVATAQPQPARKGMGWGVLAS